MPWREFWNRPHRIYVNDRHRRVHYRRVADDILAVLPAPGAAVLDFGCGEALEAERIAASCGHLFLCDAAPRVRHRLHQRLAGVAGITILADDELETLPPHGLDLIVVNSVLQYISRNHLEGLLAAWHTRLAPKGLLVLADVLPPTGRMLDDVLALLRTAARHGFLPAAMVGLVSLAFSDYRRLRNKVGLTHYAEADLLSLLHRCGFHAERSAHNFGFDPTRMSFHAGPR